MTITPVTSDISGQLPYNLEAEQSVLGALLIDPDKLPDVLSVLKSECFFRRQHQEIFATISSMFVASSTIDFITVLDYVKQRKIFSSDDEAKLYLTQLAEVVPTTANVMSYAKIVQEKYILRSLVGTLEEVVAASRDGSVEPQTLMDKAEQSIYEIRRGREHTSLVHIRDIMHDTYDRLQQLGGENREEFLGVPTGFSGLDAVMTGLNRSDLLFLAARPGMGKTSFALNVATQVAARKSQSVAIFSLEMSREQLVSRILSSEALVPSEKLRTGLLDGDDWVRIAAVSQRISDYPIYVDDTAALTVAEMKGKLRRLGDVGLVIIDYLQLMQGSKRNDNRVQEVSEITRNLKILAKEFHIPVLVLSQLSRGPESRGDKRPMLSDLRESGSIEQDADIVLFLYRDAYYNRDSDEQNVAECIIAKNRHGETGTVRVGWNGQFTRFTNLELNTYGDY